MAQSLFIEEIDLWLPKPPKDLNRGFISQLKETSMSSDMR